MAQEQTLYNVTDEDIELLGGFVVPANGELVVPAHIVRHPATQSRVKQMRLSSERPMIATSKPLARAQTKKAKADY